MRQHTRIASVLLGFFAVTILSANAWAGMYNRQLRNASYVFHKTLDLRSGFTYTISTANLSPGSNTVLYLWNELTNTQVAMNDDYSGLASRVVYSPPTSGNYRIVVRAYRAWTGGTCDVLVDRGSGPQTFASGTAFGGDSYSVDAYTSLTSGDTIQTAFAPGGTKDTILWAFDASGNLIAIDDDGGVGWASKISVTTPIRWITVSTFGQSAGQAFVITNDAAGDLDGDGLGPQLEASLCTCDTDLTIQDASCKYSSCFFGGLVNPRDSDGDGIRDDYEVFGRSRIGPSSRDFDQHLPAWGANPARMDIFLEGDFADNDKTPPKNGWADDFVNLSDAQVSARIDTIIAPYNDPHATALLKNRDNSTSIAIHVDIGRNPADPTDTRYGDWGGSDKDIAWDEKDTAPTLERFAESRHGIFRRIQLAYGGGGNGPINTAFFTCGSGLGACAHELGHTLGLNHGGAEATNCKPNYPSIMNYCAGGGKFSKGNVSTVNPTILREYEYTTSTPYPDAQACLDLKNAFPSRVDTLLRPNGCSFDFDENNIFNSAGTTYGFIYSYGQSWTADYDRGRSNQWKVPYHGQAGVLDVNHDNLAAPSLAMGDGNYTYLAFLTDGGDVRVWHTTNSFASCKDTSCWTTDFKYPANAQSGLAPAVLALGTDQLLLLWHDATSGGTIRYARLGAYSGSATPRRSVLASGAIPGTASASEGSDFVLARRHDNKPTLYFVSSSGVACEHDVYRSVFDPTTNSWSATATKITDTIGGDLKACAVIASGTKPGTPYQQTLLATSVKTDVYPAFGQRYGIEVHELGASGGWTKTPDPNQRLDYRAKTPYITRGGLQYSSLMQRWVLMFVGNNAYWENHWNHHQVFEEPRWHITGFNDLVWDKGSRFDNRWHDTRAGIALLGWQGYIQGQGISPSNLRYAGIFESRDNYNTPPFAGKEKSFVEFRPFADDVRNVDLTDHDDWPRLLNHICTSLHRGKPLSEHEPALCVAPSATPFSGLSPVCEQLKTSIMGAVAENLTCVSDTDCTVVGQKADCSACVPSLNGSSAGLAVNKSVAANIEALFAAYNNPEVCPNAPLICHEAPLTKVRCEAGQCKASEGACSFGDDVPTW